MSGEDMDTRDAGHVEHPSWLGYLTQTAADGSTVGTAGRRHRLARQQGGTHHMAMNDEERLRAAVGRALKFQPYHSDNLVAQYIDNMRAEGVTLTPPPAPEPTYTIRLTESERHTACFLLRKMHVEASYDGSSGAYQDRIEGIIQKIATATPDPEPGT